MIEASSASAPPSNVKDISMRSAGPRVMSARSSGAAYAASAAGSSYLRMWTKSSGGIVSPAPDVETGSGASASVIAAAKKENRKKMMSPNGDRARQRQVLCLAADEAMAFFRSALLV